MNFEDDDDKDDNDEKAFKVFDGQVVKEVVDPEE